MRSGAIFPSLKLKTATPLPVAPLTPPRGPVSEAMLAKMCFPSRLKASPE
jgi:hypothetical protein